MSFRLDRAVTLSVFHPLVRHTHARRVPILMYHGISDPDGGQHPYYQTRTSPAVFAEQMNWLHVHEYHAVPLQAAIAYLEGKMDLTGGSVVLTFDDGFRDFYTEAAPVLLRHGFTATVFLPTAYIRDITRRFKGADCLTWSEVRELSAMDFDFGSHTVGHVQLHALGNGELENELKRSKQTIEDNLGVGVDLFSYPYAFPENDRDFLARLRDRLTSSGYRAGVSTAIGTAAQHDDKFFLKRLPMNHWDDNALLQAKLEGGYDWLHPVQYWSKCVRSHFHHA